MAYPVSRALTRMSGSFGPRKPIKLSNGAFSPSFHGGVDFTPTVKSTPLPVYAVGAGSVYGVNLGSGAAGKNVMLRLRDGSLWWYGHLSRIDVRPGQAVRDGQQVGLMGATGNTTGVHLHLERHYPRIDVETDPWPFIEHERDIDGLTSSWQTGKPSLPEGDSGTAEGELTMSDIKELRDELAALRADIKRVDDRTDSMNQRLGGSVKAGDNLTVIARSINRKLAELLNRG